MIELFFFLARVFVKKVVYEVYIPFHVENFL